MRSKMVWWMAWVFVSGCASGPELVEREESRVVFDTNALWVISDADMAGTGYADGKLRQVPGQRDALTKLSSGSGALAMSSSTTASNSVVGWPGSVALSPDCQRVYVLEVKGEVDDAVEEVDSAYTDLPEGEYLRVFSTDGAPRELDAVRIGHSPRSVDLAPSGSWAVVPNARGGGELAIVALTASGFGRVRRVPIDAQGYKPTPHTVGPQFARIHPGGEVIAVHLGNTHVLFLRASLDRDGVPESLEPMGEPLEVGTWLAKGMWSVDGAHYLAADTAWGPSNLGAVRNGPGFVHSVRWGEGGHEVVSSAEVSLSPESFAMDRGGSLLAVINMERTYLPDNMPFSLFGRRARSSLSLVTFDAETGVLRTVDGPLGFDGVLPEDAVFDADGDALAVAVFHERSDEPTEGWVEVFAIERSGDTPRVSPTGQRVPVARGAHGLAVCHGSASRP